jgi:hypothetical protein
MKYVKLFEDFISEAQRSLGKQDKNTAKAILAYFYATVGTKEAKKISTPLESDEVWDFFGLGNDDVEMLQQISKSKLNVNNIPSSLTMRNVVTVAADNGKQYSFDENDFTEDGNTIVLDALKMTNRDFLDKLIKQGIIKKPTYK